MLQRGSTYQSQRGQAVEQFRKVKNDREYARRMMQKVWKYFLLFWCIVTPISVIAHCWQEGTTAHLMTWVVYNLLGVFFSAVLVHFFRGLVLLAIILISLPFRIAADFVQGIRDGAGR